MVPAMAAAVALILQAAVGHAFSASQVGMGGVTVLSDDVAGALSGNPALLSAKGSVYQVTADASNDVRIWHAHFFDSCISGPWPSYGTHTYSDAQTRRTAIWAGQSFVSAPLTPDITIAFGGEGSSEISSASMVQSSSQYDAATGVTDPWFSADSWRSSRWTGHFTAGVGVNLPPVSLGLSVPFYTTPNLFAYRLDGGVLLDVQGLRIGGTARFGLWGDRDYSLVPGVAYTFPAIRLTVGADLKYVNGETAGFAGWEMPFRGIASSSVGAQVETLRVLVLRMGAERIAGTADYYGVKTPPNNILHAGLCFTLGSLVLSYGLGTTLGSTREMVTHTSHGDEYRSIGRVAVHSLGIAYVSGHTKPWLGGSLQE